MMTFKAYGALAPQSKLAPLTISRRSLNTDDVQIQILYCGVCHSDLHTARNEWRGTQYPCVPGHEIVGRVTAVGSGVQDLKPGVLAAVGCMVDSCGCCASCVEGEEQYCESGFTGTYNGPIYGGENTFGGYSESIVVKRAFVLKVHHAESDLPRVAPLLCAGITLYSPLKHFGAGPSTKVGIVGLGGLGHMGVKLARAMGAEVTLFTTSEGKIDDGLRLGAHHVIVSKDPEAMTKFTGQLDLIIDTVAVSHDLDAYLNLLSKNGHLVLVGAPEEPHPAFQPFTLIFKRRSIAGSLIGGIAETQEMLDFCARHQVLSDIELIPISAINDAYERMLRSDVRYRFVIDMATI
ncbi:MAG TPA: hydroxyacid dehydrogenase [Methylococcaceae bacterium]|nr:hydroxyacid dehydrogenase [Methylococcaceae bacterium]